MPAPVALTLPVGTTLVGLTRQLDEDLGLVPGPEASIGHTWYDTFDWRLYDAGLVLEHEHVDAAPPAPAAFLRLRRLGTSAPVVEVALDQVSHRVDALPDRRLVEQLTGPAGNRALVAVASSAGRTRVHRLVDGESKTVVRVIVSDATATARAERGPGAHLLPSLVVVPVRGHDAEFEGTVARLRRMLAADAGPDPMVVAARAAGLEPGVDPSRFAVAVPAEASAAEAIRLLLSRLLRIMVVNEPGVRADLDIEFLHDFRVAVRRARSIVAAAKGVLPEERRRWMADELRWLGTETTPVRDLDVTLEELEGDDPDLDPWRGELGPVLDDLAERRAVGLVELVAALDTDRYHRFVAEARRFLSSDWGKAPVAADVFVHKRLRRAHKAVLELGHAAVTPEEWHEVRKAAKRLRYLLEGFRALLPAEDTAAAVSSLKRFQEVLGAMQDSVVHVELARAAAETLVARGATPAQHQAAGALIEQSLARGRQAYARCGERFERFSTDSSTRRFTRLWTVAPDPTPDPEPAAAPHPDDAAAADDGAS